MPIVPRKTDYCDAACLCAATNADPDRCVNGVPTKATDDAVFELFLKSQRTVTGRMPPTPEFQTVPACDMRREAPPSLVVRDFASLERRIAAAQAGDLVAVASNLDWADGERRIKRSPCVSVPSSGNEPCRSPSPLNNPGFAGPYGPQLGLADLARQIKMRLRVHLQQMRQDEASQKRQSAGYHAGAAEALEQLAIGLANEIRGQAADEFLKGCGLEVQEDAE